MEGVAEDSSSVNLILFWLCDIRKLKTVGFMKGMRCKFTKMQFQRRPMFDAVRMPGYRVGGFSRWEWWSRTRFIGFLAAFRRQNLELLILNANCCAFVAMFIWQFICTKCLLRCQCMSISRYRKRNGNKDNKIFVCDRIEYIWFNVNFQCQTINTF